MLATPVIGYLGSAFSGYPVRYFGGMLPAWSAKHEAAKDLMSVLHLAFAWVLATAVTVHVLAVVRHTVHGGSAMLGRMGWRRAVVPPRRRASSQA